MIIFYNVACSLNDLYLYYFNSKIKTDLGSDFISLLTSKVSSEITSFLI
jgi:hypothetical protein